MLNSREKMRPEFDGNPERRKPIQEINLTAETQRNAASSIWRERMPNREPLGLGEISHITHICAKSGLYVNIGTDPIPGELRFLLSSHGVR